MVDEYIIIFISLYYSTGQENGLRMILNAEHYENVHGISTDSGFKVTKWIRDFCFQHEMCFNSLQFAAWVSTNGSP